MSIRIGNLTLKSRVYVPPMAGVTDMVFRSVLRRLGADCLLSTEMVSSRALMNKPESRIMDLQDNESPIGVQIFGHEPDVMAHAAQLAEQKGADFIDINMGCPVPKITKGKDGCALMREPELAYEIVTAVKGAIKIPLTVKFRLGWDDNSRNAVEFGTMLESAGVAAVTVHGRTRQQLYSGKADWNYIAKVKEALAIPVFGNGDIFAAADALALLEVSGCDGVAVARGCLGNPWLILGIEKLLKGQDLAEPPNDVDKLIVAFQHCLGLMRYKGSRIGANESRRHLSYYTKGLHNSHLFRKSLTQISSADDALSVLAELAKNLGGKAEEERFLLAVEQDYLEYCKYPGKGDHNGQDCVKTPINGSIISPVAIP